MSGANLSRGLLLFEQARFELAEPEFRQVLASDPNNSMAHALLALCLSRREQFQAATEEAQAAVRLAPDLPFGYYALASVLQDRNHLEEATEAITEAIRLDPEHADYHALRASVRLGQRRWADALAAAEQGLQCDAEHVSCTNLRAVALVKLGRKHEAGATIDSALAKNPENALTHANQGWTYLEKGDHAKALEHFREALRLDPQNEWARQGIVEALKARHWIYGVMLRYFLWMSKLSSRVQWMVIIGFYFLQKGLKALAVSKPELNPIILPILILYVVFVILTWIADPLFNLVLRLSRFGRLALSREQTVASNWVGACILGAVLCAVTAVLARNENFLVAAMVVGVLVLPVAGIFKCHAGWPRNVMASGTAILALLGFGAVASFFLPTTGSSETPSGNGLLNLFLMGIFVSTIGVNFLAAARPRR